jgi:hypothetical protein
MNKITDNSDIYVIGAFMVDMANSESNLNYVVDLCKGLRPTLLAELRNKYKPDSKTAALVCSNGEITKLVADFFPSAEIILLKKTEMEATAVIIIDDIKIMLEIKNYKKLTNANKQTQFMNDMVDNNNKYDAAIMISCQSGIANRRNFAFETYKNKTAIFLSYGGHSVSWGILLILHMKHLKDNKTTDAVAHMLKIEIDNIETCIAQNAEIRNMLQGTRDAVLQTLDKEIKQGNHMLDISDQRLKNTIQRFMKNTDTKNTKQPLITVHKSSWKDKTIKDLKEIAKEKNIVIAGLNRKLDIIQKMEAHLEA